MTATPESPSVLLRRAADRLDELARAVAATDVPDDLPWHTEPCADDERGDCSCIVAQGRTSHHDEPPQPMFYVADAETPELAAWIAAVDPRTGRALASMLRAAIPMADEPWADEEVAIVTAALDVARKILREATA